VKEVANDNGNDMHENSKSV